VLRAVSGATGPGGYPWGAAPLVRAYQNATVADVTGDGTYYNVLFNTELTDRTASFKSATGAFTAPFAGVYLFVGAVSLDQLGAASRVELRLQATGQTNYQLFNVPGGSAGFGVYQFAVAVQMAANDTCTVQIYAGGTTKTVDVFGAATTTRWTYLTIFPAAQT